MEAVILAGGFGTRIQPLTYTRPKPLLPLLNRPMLATILDSLPEVVRRIILPVNYLREQIEAYFEDHPDPRIVLVEEFNPLGTGGAIKNCEDHLTGTFLVVNGDVVSSIDLSALIAHHRAKRAQATISLWPVAEPWHFGVVKLEPDGRISSFVEKPARGTQPSNLINAGHYVLDLEVLDEIETGRLFSIEREVYANWARTGKALYGFPFQGYWVDCGRPESLLEAHATLLAHRHETQVVHPSAKVNPKASVEGSAVDADCRVSAGARVRRSILMPGVQIGKNVEVTDSILGEGVEVEEGARLERVVAGDFAIIQAQSRIADQRIGLRAAEQEA